MVSAPASGSRGRRLKMCTELVNSLAGVAVIKRASVCAWFGVGGKAVFQVRRAGFGGGDRPLGVIHLRQDGGIQPAQGWSGFQTGRNAL